ncbi:MAG: hypothetical protein HGGPFJEG_01009 [Ignavibacteria bacterium]|nr:hypothetical protein [Ignavibacteria bacterium]
MPDKLFYIKTKYTAGETIDEFLEGFPSVRKEQFKKEFNEFETSTVRDNNWVGIKNGKLLRLAIDKYHKIYY